ncbi:hypothetical protein GOP47_0012205 [Adiantum capillus-veneris]|uniref:Uncharacterized protein n=1 Tax=Adiantum capillus-veneris TaxID=13818 RepID=A0A9D4ZE87_ADICA|nr:hypothetical protein GOP47_0012205 [Adiantum capillus-veneris]
MEARRGAAEAMQRRMQAALLAELQELERELLQRFESSCPATTPSTLNVLNSTKLAIATRIAASQARIAALLESVNDCLDLAPPDLDACTSSTMAAPAITSPSAASSDRPRRVTFAS